MAAGAGAIIALDNYAILKAKRLQLLNIPVVNISFMGPVEFLDPKTTYIGALQELCRMGDSDQIKKAAARALKKLNHEYNQAELLLLTILISPSEEELLLTPGFVEWVSELIDHYHKYSFDTLTKALTEFVAYLYQGGDVALSLSIYNSDLFFSSHLPLTTFFMNMREGRQNIFLTFFGDEFLLDLYASMFMDIIQSKRSRAHLSYVQNFLKAFGLEKSFDSCLYQTEPKKILASEATKKMLTKYFDKEDQGRIKWQITDGPWDWGHITFHAQWLNPSPLIFDILQAILDRDFSLRLIAELFSIFGNKTSRMRFFDAQSIYDKTFKIVKYGNREYPLLSCIVLNFAIHNTLKNSFDLAAIFEKLIEINPVKFKSALNQALLDAVGHEGVEAFELLSFAYQRYDSSISNETRLKVAELLSPTRATAASTSLAFQPTLTLIQAKSTIAADDDKLNDSGIEMIEISRIAAPPSGTAKVVESTSSSTDLSHL